MTTTLHTIEAEDGRLTFWVDSRDTTGRLVNAEPFASMVAAQVFAASLKS